MREMSVAEQRYQAVLAVFSDGRTVPEVAGQWKVSRQTLHGWLTRYEAAGLEGLADRSHRPGSCPAPLSARTAGRGGSLCRPLCSGSCRRCTVDFLGAAYERESCTATT
jgi:transposase-like protein